MQKLLGIMEVLNVYISMKFMYSISCIDSELLNLTSMLETWRFLLGNIVGNFVSVKTK